MVSGFRRRWLHEPRDVKHELVSRVHDHVIRMDAEQTSQVTAESCGAGRLAPQYAWRATAPAGPRGTADQASSLSVLIGRSETQSVLIIRSRTCVCPEVSTIASCSGVIVVMTWCRSIGSIASWSRRRRVAVVTQANRCQSAGPQSCPENVIRSLSQAHSYLSLIVYCGLASGLSC